MLSKEDIESLGWKEDSWSDKNIFIFTIKEFILFFENENKISITNKDKNRDTKCGYFHHYIFEGVITTKEELKTLMKQLNING